MTLVNMKRLLRLPKPCTSERKLVFGQRKCLILQQKLSKSKESRRERKGMFGWRETVRTVGEHCAGYIWRCFHYTNISSDALPPCNGIERTSTVLFNGSHTKGINIGLSAIRPIYIMHSLRL